MNPHNLESALDFTPARPLDDFIQLSPIGLFPHPRGLQNVDKAALEALVKNFNSFLSRLGRRFAGLPFYVGHPDVPGYGHSSSDRKAYGWIMDLEAREDGLYGRTKWSAAGRDLIRQGHYKFLSPTWSVENIGHNQGRPIYRPTQLISVGLTNEPNLPVLPLANSDTPEEPDRLTGLPLEFSPERRTAESSKSEIREPKSETGEREKEEANSHSTPANTPARPDAPSVPAPEAQSQTSSPDSPDLSPPTSDLNSVSSFELRLSTLEECLANCQRELVQVQDRFLSTILDNAMFAARIFPAERERWRAALQEDFATAYEHLANAQPLLRTKLKSDQLSPAPAAGAFAEKQKRMHTLVNERMRATGLNYHDAWMQVRAENPSII